MTIVNPYNAEGTLWLKGQMHTHTTRSDGRREPQEVIDEYASLGHDFHMFADHDTYGTYDELDARGMLLIPGNEITAHGPHMLHVNASSLVKPDIDRQKVIDAVAADGGFAICNHPNWQEHYNHFPQELLEDLEGYTGIEIYNGVIKRLFGYEIATDRWDMLLSQGRKIWGFGSDDSHADGDAGQAWNVVRVKERTVEAVLEALQNGSFYVSTGVIIDSIDVFGNHIRVSAPNAHKLIVTGMHGQRLAEIQGTELTFAVTDEMHGYVRITAVGEPDMYAFTQPFQIKRQRPGLAEGEVLKHTVARIDKPAELDGWRGDAIWDSIAPLQRFVDAGTAKTSPFSPDVRLVTDGHSLFISAVCPEPDPEHMKVNVQADGEERTWNDDGIEIFIDPDGQHKNYIHLMVNADGFHHDHGYGREALAGPITVKAGCRDYAYILELDIPLTALGETVSLDGVWAFNISRNKYSQPAERCQWAFTGGANHSPRLFGEITFNK